MCSKLLGTPWVFLKGITSKTGKAIPGRIEAAAGLSILLAETGIEAMVAIGKLDYFYNLDHYTLLENFACFRPAGAVSRALSRVTRELFAMPATSYLEGWLEVVQYCISDLLLFSG